MSGGPGRMEAARARPKSIEWSAVVLNADGTVKEDLGLVSAYNSNPIINVWLKIKIWFTRKFLRSQ